MKTAAIALWSIVLMLLLGGAALAISPLYLDGGLLNWFSPAGENIIGYLANLVFSVILGVLLFAGGAALAVAFGIAGTVMAISARKSIHIYENDPEPKDPVPNRKRPSDGDGV